MWAYCMQKRVGSNILKVRFLGVLDHGHRCTTVQHSLFHSLPLVATTVDDANGFRIEFCGFWGAQRPQSSERRGQLDHGSQP